MVSRAPIPLALLALLGWTATARAQSAPEPNTVETGFGLGVFALADDHELYAPRTREVRPLQPGPMLTWRGAYLPLRMLGIEVEIDLVRLAGAADTTATVVVPRAHVMVQLPNRVAPFVLAGGGILSSSSRALGDDSDPMGYAGLGAKFYWRDGVSLRADLRLIRSSRAERDGAGKGTNHLQVSVGAAWVFGAAPAAPAAPAATPPPPPPLPPPPTPTPKPSPTPATLGTHTSVWFELNQHELTEAGQQVLNRVADQILRDARIARVRIEGHADDDGSHADNILLSARRAQRVKRYLIARGVASDRLVSRGLGSAHADVQNNAKNRRVDLSIDDEPAP